LCDPFAEITVQTNLDEADVSGLLAETLAADVEPILANDAMVVAAHAAKRSRARQGHYREHEIFQLRTRNEPNPKQGGGSNNTCSVVTSK